MANRWACLIRLPYFYDDVRAALAAEGIQETYPTTNAEPDSSNPTEVRVIVPGESEALADATLMKACHRFSGWECPSAWAPMPDHWQG
jgi:hypothetical protein